MSHSPFRNAHSTLLIISLFLGTACQTFEKVATIKLPKVRADQAQLTGADFSGLDFVINLDVDNPNAYGLNLVGFEYQLQVDNQSLLTGSQSETQTLKANQHSNLAVPMHIAFSDLATTIPELLKQDSFDYLFSAQLTFKIPVLNSVTVPIEQKGSLPIIRPPKISDLKLKKKGINLTGADLEIHLNIDNPNAFDFQMKSFQYSFKGNDQTWANGTTSDPIALSQKSESSVTIPIHLNFLAIGKTALQLLTGGKSFTSALDGTMTLNSSLDYLPEKTLPVTIQKTLSLD